MSDRPQYHLSKENLAKVFAAWIAEAKEGGWPPADDVTGEESASTFVDYVKKTLEPINGPAEGEPEITH